MEHIRATIVGLVSVATAAVQISPEWTIDLKTAAAVIMPVFAGVWWVSRWMSKVERKLAEGEAHRTAMRDEMATLKKMVKATLPRHVQREFEESEEG